MVVELRANASSRTPARLNLQPAIDPKVGSFFSARLGFFGREINAGDCTMGRKRAVAGTRNPIRRRPGMLVLSLAITIDSNVVPAVFVAAVRRS